MNEPFFEVCSVALSYRPYRWNHEPGIAALPNGDLLAVWGATAQGPFRDTKIAGSTSSDGGRTWADPVVLAFDADSRTSDPSLLVTGDTVILQYGVYPFGEKQHGDKRFRYRSGILMQKTSTDNGRSWSKAVRIETGKVQCGTPHEGIKLRNGTLVWPFYWELNCEEGAEPFEAEMAGVASLLTSSDNGQTWGKGSDIRIDVCGGADEPSIVELTDGNLFMLMRTTSGRLYQAWSSDLGDVWSRPEPSPLVSPAAPAALHRISFQPDIVVAVWNNSPLNRFPLDTAVSYDGCKTWSHSRMISSPGCQVSYPGMTVAQDGTIVVVYQQWHETLYNDTSEYTDITADIKCARFNESWLEDSPFVSPRTV